MRPPSIPDAAPPEKQNSAHTPWTDAELPYHCCLCITDLPLPLYSRTGRRARARRASAIGRRSTSRTLAATYRRADAAVAFSSARLFYARTVDRALVHRYDDKQSSATALNADVHAAAAAHHDVASATRRTAPLLRLLDGTHPAVITSTVTSSQDDHAATRPSSPVPAQATTLPPGPAPSQLPSLNMSRDFLSLALLPPSTTEHVRGPPRRRPPS
ncbi:hypothetical protein HYPSUDRAFT_201424 [Hypholoma sublateritium FD-334 SS-4]|uniref:Uncharacterized protein n=1 Tax=Hypholoma sublateritium (strain FD-334 SS-4) TaxID=945553 RepID=A0A0D2PUZ3_HYPSF|nr:hypothetical protein HYPSUDRAFT_201424 [Hypholoma sublateritium FD-334 SS-4]